jgi:hypothetical protein
VRQLTTQQVELFPVTWALAELEQALDRIVADDPVLLAQDINVQAVGVDIERNTADVGVLALTTAKEDALKARYGSIIFVRDEQIIPATQSRFEFTDPIIAGLRISGPNNCTNAFTAQAGFIVNGQSTIYNVTFTAAHCGPSNSLWYQGDQELGRVYRRRFGGKLDAMIIRTNRGVRSQVYITSKTKQLINRLQRAGRERVGHETICQSGATSRSPRCGILAGTREVIRVDGVRLVEQRKFRRYSGSGVDLCRKGDSGAPVYHGRVGKGIVSSVSKDNRFCYYTHIDHAFRGLVTGTG